MNFPSVPTDNLYKFCAISGLALTLFGLTYPVQKIIDLQTKVADLTTEVKIMQKRTNYLRDDTAQLAQLKDATLQQVLELEIKGREAEIGAIRLSGESDKIGLLLNQILFMFIVSSLLSSGGFILAKFGFIRWYTRVQRPADAIIAAQESSTDI